MQKISSETWIRTIILVVTLFNQILTAAGKNPLPFSENSLYTLLSSLFCAGASLWAWWKNNSFTAPALQADAYLAVLKSAEEDKTKE